MATKLWCVVGLIPVLLGALLGCASPPPSPHPEAAVMAPPRVENTDQARLKAALQGQEMPPAEVAELSERLLADGNASLEDQETMARLELLLLKSLKGQDKTQRAVLLRNLGIIHYHQKKYKQAQQELQNSNELNPKSARTHYYLARLFAQQAQLYESKGKKKISKQQYKRAGIEMEQARKLEPSNSVYRQDIKQLLAPENGR